MVLLKNLQTHINDENCGSLLSSHDVGKNWTHFKHHLKNS
jgi:hypothetical protein